MLIDNDNDNDINVNDHRSLKSPQALQYILCLYSYLLHICTKLSFGEKRRMYRAFFSDGSADCPKSCSSENSAET